MSKSYKEQDKWNDDYWAQNRQNGIIQTAKVRCTYAEIYLPTKEGKLRTIWSFQNRFQDKDEPLLVDYPELELNFDSGSNPLLRQKRIIWCPEEDFYYPRSLHAGILTQTALEHIADLTYSDRSKTKEKIIDIILNYDGVVLYNPINWLWEATDESWKYTLTKTQQTQQKKKNTLKSLIAAAAATLIN